MDHLRELRLRIIIISAAIIAASIGGYFISNQVFAILSAPYFGAFPASTLIGTGPHEAFLLRVKVAIFTGIVISAPIIFHQFWKFVAPGLHQHERRLMAPFVAAASLLFFAGIYFCYAKIMPLTLSFFYNQYKEIGVTPTIRITEHLAFIIKLTVGFGLLFEMPVAAFFLGKAGIIDHKFLLRYARHAVVGMFVVGAILTPDVFTQTLMAVPLMALYGLSILVVKLTEQKEAPAPSDSEVKAFAEKPN